MPSSHLKMNQTAQLCPLVRFLAAKVMLTILHPVRRKRPSSNLALRQGFLENGRAKYTMITHKRAAAQGCPPPVAISGDNI